LKNNFRLAPGSLARKLFRGVLKPRPRKFHKGMAGSVGILGGAAGMAGAALLAGRAALKLGAGRVYVGFLNENPVGLDFAAPELMLRHATTCSARISTRWWPDRAWARARAPKRWSER